MECRIGDPLDNAIYFEGEFEPELRLSLEPLASSLSTIIDVGCNIGYVSCLLGWLTRGRARILSLDPNPEMVARCEANMKLNGFASEAIVCAAGKVEEFRSFHVPRHRPSFASFGRVAHDSEKIDVPVRPLVQLAHAKGLAPIDLLKIDVEGFEPEVLAGLGDLDVRNIYFEFSPENLQNCGFSPDDLWRLPLWKRYRLALLEAGTGRPLSFQPGEALDRETEIVWAQAIS